MRYSADKADDPRFGAGVPGAADGPKSLVPQQAWADAAQDMREGADATAGGGTPADLQTLPAEPATAAPDRHPWGDGEHEKTADTARLNTAPVTGPAAAAPNLPFEQVVQAEQDAAKVRQEKQRKREAALLEWLVAILIALVVAVILTQVIFVNAQIPSQSMLNTIQVGDRVIGFRMSYWFSEPQRGDIIIFKYPDDETQYYVKRVIGLPGEELLIEDGLVYINGALLEEDTEYVVGTLRGNFGPYQIPDDAYFVMGDNRNDSWDSRYWENTFVTTHQVVGKAVYRIFPNPGKLE